jgi:hypothetical protein
MARRRFNKQKTRIRRASTKSFKRMRRSTRKSGMGSAMNLALGAGLYGASRQYISNLLTPLTAKIPLGDYADEAAMLGASYALMKGKVPFVNKVPISRDIGRAGFVIESARIGAGLMAGSGLGATTSNTHNGVVYL